MLSITVLHYNNEKLTNQCAGSIDRQEIPFEHEKIIIDNGSDKPMPLREGWKVYRIENNVGNIGGQNACFSAANFDNVLFVSNDVIFMPSAIKKMVQDYDDNSQVMPMLIQPDGKTDSMGLKFLWPGYASNMKKEGIMDAIPSITYMMHKEAFNIVGKFDREFQSSHEDLDMGFRLRKMGFGLKLSGARAIHIGNQTLSKMPYYNRKLIAKARQRFLSKHYTGLGRIIRKAITGALDNSKTAIHEALSSRSS